MTATAPLAASIAPPVAEPIITPVIEMVSVDEIEPNPFQYRTVIEDEDFLGMIASVRSGGVRQPILLRPVEGKLHKGVRFQLIAGERRWRAAVAAERTAIPAIVRPMDDEQALEEALIENAQRTDPPHLATAHGIRRRMEMAAKKGQPMSESQVGQLLGKSLGFIRNHLELFKLDEPLQQLVAERNDAMSSAFELQKIKDHRDYRPLIEDVRTGKANWRDVKKRVDWIVEHQKLRQESQRAPDQFTRSALAQKRAREKEAAREVRESLSKARQHLSNLEAWLNYLPAKTFSEEIAPALKTLAAHAEKMGGKITA